MCSRTPETTFLPKPAARISRGNYMLRLTIDSLAPEAALLERAEAIIRGGGIVALPTDTLYGLAVDPWNGEAVRRLLAVKRRPAERALPLIASDVAQVVSCLGELPPLASALARRFWPGALTLLVEAPELLRSTVTAGEESVGIRVPDCALAQALCLTCQRPLTATSANISGNPPSDDPEVVAMTMGHLIDALVDGGRTAGGPSSTIVDTTNSTLRLIRAGAIPWDEIRTFADASRTA